MKTSEYLPKAGQIEKIHFSLESFVSGDDQIVSGHFLGINEALRRHSGVNEDFEARLLVNVFRDFVIPLITDGRWRNYQRGGGQAWLAGAARPAMRTVIRTALRVGQIVSDAFRVLHHAASVALNAMLTGLVFVFGTDAARTFQKVDLTNLDRWR